MHMQLASHILSYLQISVRSGKVLCKRYRNHVARNVACNVALHNLKHAHRVRRGQEEKTVSPTGRRHSIAQTPFFGHEETAISQPWA